MRETSVRGPAIDLGEFERRLRGPQRPAQAADPLSELARLVHGEEAQASDPYGRILAETRDAHAEAAQLRGSYDAAPPVAAEPPYYPQPSMDQPLEPAYPVDPDYRDLPPGYDPQQGTAYDPAYYGAESGWSDDAQYLDYGQSDEHYEDRYGGWRSRFRPWHAVVAISLVAVLSIGFAFWHRSGSNASREIATIVAPEGPVKVKPSVEADASAPDASSAVVLDRKEQAPVQQVVTNQEQAVDPSVAPNVAQLGAGPVDLPHEPAPAIAPPKRVKTVTVRPDGSRVEEGALPPAVAMASRPAEQAGPAAASAMGAATATPPSQAKPTATPPRIAKPKPAPKVASAEEAPDAASDADAAPAGKGGYAVQFGAAESEEDARALLKTVVSKYRAQLGGLKPTFKMATVNEKTVYRVRVAGVSKESANAICSKVKATGGACFVAGN
jgi:hypothetical protein